MSEQVNIPTTNHSIERTASTREKTTMMWFQSITKNYP